MSKKVILLALAAALACGLSGCESCSRMGKSITSDMGGGLNRRVTLYDYDGEVLGVWEGKFDVSSSETETYFDVNGKRVIIQGGIVVNEEVSVSGDAK